MSTVLDHDEIRDLLAVYAVDAIGDRSEREAVERHLETCAECRAEVEEHREALASLTSEKSDEAALQVWGSLRERIAATGASERVGSPEESGAVVPFRRRPWRLVAGAATVAAASVLVTLAVTRDGSSGNPTQTAAIVAADQQTGAVTGRVQVFDPESASGRLVVNLENVPDAPAGHHYEVWVLRPGERVEMEPVGAFTPQGGRADLDLSLPGPGEYVAVDISIQENGGSPVHSGKSLAGATLS
jgi:anti-sigma-K factor RskA